MARARDGTSATRPALVTAGGLLLALGLLQILQQVIGVFKPRPEIQVSLILAAGLGALCAQRVSAGSGRQDRVAVVSGVGCGMSLVAAIVVVLVSGFSLPSQPSIAAQVQAIRANARTSGFDRTVYLRTSLRAGTTAHLFVLDPAPREEKGRVTYASTELRLYEELDGRLRRRLTFQPVGPKGGFVFQSTPTSDRFAFDSTIDVSSVLLRLMDSLDIDQNGEAEVLAYYEVVDNDTRIPRQIPVVLAWSDSSTRYELSALFQEPPKLGDVAPLERPIDTRGFTTRFRLNDPRAQISLGGHAVTSFFAIPEERSIVAAFDRGMRGSREALQVGVWGVGDLSDPPPLAQHCYPTREEGPPVFPTPATSVSASARDKQVRSIYRRLPEAEGGLFGFLFGDACLLGE